MSAAQPSNGKMFKYGELKLHEKKVCKGTGLLLIVTVGGIYYRGLHVHGIIIFLVVLWLFILYEGMQRLLEVSDVVINEEGISRRLYGWVWKTIRWDNVSRIYALEVYDRPLNTKLWVYNVFPIVKDRINLFSSGKIMVVETIEHVNELIEIINKRVSERHIPLQVKQNGEITAVDHLAFSSRRPR